MHAAKQAGMVLRRQYTALAKRPVANIVARPNDKNILECHYVITGPQGTPYEGGQYHGVVCVVLVLLLAPLRVGDERGHSSSSLKNFLSSRPPS